MGVFTFVTVALFAHLAAGLGKLEVLYRWREIDYEFPTPADRDTLIKNHNFIPGNPVPIDLDVWQTENVRKIFVTTPRFKDGVPVSLSTLVDDPTGESSLLRPYPSWSWHSDQKCNGMTSVFRTQIDKCDRLWVIDSGMVDLFKYPRRRACQPQVLAFNLVNDKISGRYRFPDNVLLEGSVLSTIAVDVRDAHRNCLDTFVYVADVTGYQLLVFDARRAKSWRITSNTMYPTPPYGVFHVNGVEFDLMDGVIGLALGPMHKGDRTLYYHPFAGLREAWVSTSILRNESLFATGFNGAPRQFHMSDEVKHSQTAPEVMNKHGSLFFAPVASNALYCWNSQKPYKSKAIQEIARDDTNLQFVSGIKVSELPTGEDELWLLSDRFHLVMVGQMDPQEVNFRILKGKVSDLTRGTLCVSDKPVHFPDSERPNRRNSGYGQFSG